MPSIDVAAICITSDYSVTFPRNDALPASVRLYSPAPDLPTDQFGLIIHSVLGYSASSAFFTSS